MIPDCYRGTDVRLKLATIGETGETACSPSVDRRIWTVSDSVNIKLQFYFKDLANPQNCAVSEPRSSASSGAGGEVRAPSRCHRDGESPDLRG